MKNKGIMTGFILILFFITFLLLKDPFIGLADNSDYYRVIQPLGFEPQINNRYFYAYNFYTINGMDADNATASLSKILKPDVENNNEYFSTQFIFIKIAMIINFIIKIAAGKSPEIFNIKILGILYAVFYSYGLYLFIKNINIKSIFLKVIFVILSIFILCDIGYVIYFNSFFGEAPIISSIMLVAGSCIAFIKSEDTKKSIYYGIVFFISGILLTGAKVANTPIGILIGLFSILFLKIKKDKIIKAIVFSGSLIIIIFSAFYYTSAPDWMNQVNNYQAIFYGILKDSPNPEADLKQLGISNKYLTLANSHGFLENNQFDIYSDEFQKEVYDKASFINILKFYLLNPDRLIDKLILSADNSVIIRPSYLGNYSKEDVAERLSFTDRFSYWSNLRTNTLGNAFYIIAVYSILYFIINVYEIINSIRDKNSHKNIYGWSGMLLFFTAMSQFVLPIIGNGEADLQKHMLLFNICFDLMLLVGVSWLMNNYKSKLILRIAPAAIMFYALIYIIVPHETQKLQSTQFNTGDFINFGIYHSKPLKWIVLNYDEKNGYLLWSEEAVDYMEFDRYDEMINENAYGSNNWETSDIRTWLNNDFKNIFSQEEQKLINKVKLRNVLSYNNVTAKAGGSRPHYWSAITSYVGQNYNTDAYFNYSEEEIFLLDCYQLNNYVYDNNIKIKKNIIDSTPAHKTRYWLRTPYYSSTSMVRIVAEDGFVYHKDANVKAGIVPAMYLNENLNVLNGNGTDDNPYSINIMIDQTEAQINEKN